MGFKAFQAGQNRKPPTGRFTLFVVLFSVSLAVILSLGRLGSEAFFFQHLALVSLFVLWCSLLAALLFFLIESRLPTLPPGARIIIWFLGCQALVVLVSLLVAFGPERLANASQPAQSEPIIFLARNLGIAAVASFLFARFFLLQQQWQAQVAAESDVRLNALQSRIRPHFLFNTLNTISSLIHDRPDQAEQATMDLADLLRTGLKDEPTHALSDELDLIRGYLRIEQLRLTDRLNIEWDISEEVPLGQQLPPLLLQPLVENAVIHGISRRAEGGALRIEGRRIRFGRIRFTVTNPLADADSRPAEGNQSALENIRQRLALAFEERYGLKTWTEDGHFKAELTIPVT